MQRRWTQAVLRGTEDKDKKQQVIVDTWKIPTTYKKKEEEGKKKTIKVAKHRNRLLRRVKEQRILLNP